MKVIAPGKLMLSGEWSVLEVGVPCVVMAIDQKVGAKGKAAKEIIFSAPDLGIEKVPASFDGKKITWNQTLDEKQLEKLGVAKNAIELTLAYLAAKHARRKPKLFEMQTFSSDTLAKLPDGKTAKVGFGSSAAVCVAIVGAILKLNGYNLEEKNTKDLVFKIACTAHYLAQGKVGSSFDIAASTYGGVIAYTRFDPKWLIQEMNSGKSTAEIMDSNWPAFTAEPLILPQNFELLTGFVGYSASTKELIVKINEAKEKNRGEYDKIISDIKGVTEKLITAIKTSNQNEITALIKQNRALLQKFSAWSSNNLETAELKTLADVAEKFGAAGKQSGSGAGDCGIAITFDSKISAKIKGAWKRKGIIVIKAKISEKGVC
jgi:phosphomevalonate kinase